MSLVLSRSGAFFSVAVVGLISVPLAIKFSTHAASVAVASETQSPENPGTNASSPNLEVALIRAGLDPRALAAAGVSSAQVSSVAAAVSAHLAQSPSAISDADQAYAQARVEHDALDRKVGGGTASPEEITALAAARQALDSARALRASRLDALHTAGSAGLSFDQRSRLSMLRFNAEKPAPIEFKVVERTEAEWVALRDALSNERSAAANGEQPNGACQTLLGSARSNSAVAAAKSAIDTNLASIQSAWSVAVGE